MPRFLLIALLAQLFLGGAPAANAQKQALKVGTREAPPFAMLNSEGEWEGLSIDLFKAVAGDLGYDYQFTKATITEMLDQTADGRLDVAAAALTITADREQRVDFTHPFSTSGLGIAVPEKGRGTNWTSILRSFLSPAFLKVVLALVAVLLAAGCGVWFFERKRNPDQFGGKPLQGLGNGFWWSAVTMTTVGYGDKYPVTLAGRVVGLIWMFTSIIIISSFTAGIASSLTIERMDGPISSAADLPRHRAAALKDSTSEAYLRAKGATVLRFGSLDDALKAVLDGRADAVVHDAPILRYQTKDLPGLRVLPGTFERQDYGFALRQNSTLRRPINVAILRRINSPWWEEIRRRYLGPDARR